MINLMIKSIFENSNKIDSIVKHVNKTNRKHCLEFALVAIAIYTMTKTIKNHEEKISNLEIELEEMKSKGE